MLRRRGAQVGDKVWVSGSLGDGAAALALLKKEQTFSEACEQYLLQRFYRPDIDFELAVQLRHCASACIDVSDGLLADLRHICTASGVGAQIFCESLPVSALWKNAVSQQRAQQWALCGGDDYRLCFTALSQHDAVLQSRGDVFCIGNIVAGSGVVALDSHFNPVELVGDGFQHF